ncbi:ATP-binding domain-containing protein [Vibrio parahaemolyticus]|nr:ATP-binding domain-containing protein [Vibrio parahaemolyticus]MBE4191253.1 ATP-binding domain-containing protein [Vibrio parahaemolyticus]HCZ9051638.1 DEAD/DEAH box helicase [Vibrio alginolyticus]
MLQINPEGYDFTATPILDDLVKRLNESSLELDGAQLFVDFPLYKGSEDNLIISQLILVSSKYGIWSLHTTDANSYSKGKLTHADDELLEVANNVFARLIRNKRLSSGFNQLKVPFSTLLYAPHFEEEELAAIELKNVHALNFHDVEQMISEREVAIDDNVFLESISTIQGAKGLWKPEDRNLTGFDENSKVAKISQIESQILLFDKDQQEGYIPALSGPQRIRGLAGSGKTVVLAMKAAITLVRAESEQSKILYTFSTKSLYQHVQRLIQRFYREFDDDLSNLDRVAIKHSWGGRTNDGVYWEACNAFNHRFLTYPEAMKYKPHDMDPFEFACKDLLDNVEISPIYDYVFVDEAQDYNKYFLRLCTKLAKNKQVTFGADVFQNIFQSQVPTAAQIYDDGTQFIKEKYLNVCYRTPLATLVCAHSVGLGVYGKQVQKIETVEHWKSLGYQVIGKDEGAFREKEDVHVLRDESHSPTLADQQARNLILMHKAANMDAEVNEVARRIINDVRSEGLSPEDILVMCADDYRCKRYFNRLTDILSEHEIYTNNIHAEKYSISDFRVKGRVTLSTIHKAKGNEAYSVYLMGTDFLSYNLNVRNRNLIFTALTRTKGWICITGVGEIVDGLFGEIETAIGNLPSIKFKYPSALEGQDIEHDLQMAESVSQKDIDSIKQLAAKFGSFEKMQEYLAESEGRKGKK